MGHQHHQIENFQDYKLSVSNPLAHELEIANSKEGRKRHNSSNDKRQHKKSKSSSGTANIPIDLSNNINSNNESSSSKGSKDFPKPNLQALNLMIKTTMEFDEADSSEATKALEKQKQRNVVVRERENLAQISERQLDSGF